MFHRVCRTMIVGMGLTLAVHLSVAAAGAPWPAGLDNEVQQVEHAFFEAMSTAATTEEMLAAATNRFNGLKKILETARAGAIGYLAGDPGSAAALQSVDASLASLVRAVMDKEMRGGGTVAPVSAAIAGGNIMSAQISMYLGLMGGGN